MKNKAIYGLISAYVALLCMAYPIETLGETNFDLRMIAIIIFTLYVGWFPGLLVTFIACIIRVMIGGDFYHIGVIVTLGGFIIAFALRRYFLMSSNRLLIASIVAIIYSVFYIVVLYFNINFLDISFYTIYYLAFYSTYIAIIYIIEKLMKFNKQFDEKWFIWIN